MTKNILVKGIEIVGILFAAFGGFLAGVAPPQAADARFAVGVASFFALIILFIIASVTKRKHRKNWIITAGVLFIVSIVSAFYYWSNSLELTFEYPPGSAQTAYISGTELTPNAREYVQQHQDTSKAKLLAMFGGLPNLSKVWPDESVKRARTKLIASYVLLVLSIASTIFALTEGVFSVGGSFNVKAQSRSGGRSVDKTKSGPSQPPDENGDSVNQE
jgi:TRAP-type uncharacterized transport system fused permease subunit